MFIKAIEKTQAPSSVGLGLHAGGQGFNSQAPLAYTFFELNTSQTRFNRPVHPPSLNLS